MGKYAIIFGTDEFALSLAESMVKLKFNVAVINIYKDTFLDLNDNLFDCFNSSLSDKKFLNTLDISSADICVIALKDDFKASLECLKILKKSGAKKIAAEASDALLEHYLKLGGADKIVHPFRDYSFITAIELTGQDILNCIYLSEVQALFERKLPDSWVGKTPSSLDIRKNYHASVIGVGRNNEFVPVTDPDFVFEKNDVMFALGNLRKVFDKAEEIK